MSEMENSWLAFQLAKRDFAMRTIDVIEMVPLGKINSLLDSPEYIRGVINLRDKIIPLVDLRKRLGMMSLYDENEKLCELLAQRKQDHINWLNELNNSVLENREFKLTTDPHKCAFGKWYDNYKCENVYIKILLDKFDEPHKQIHAIAIVIEDMIKGGKRAEAIQLIESTRETKLMKMISLFDQTISSIRENLNEIVIIASINRSTIGFAVDKVTDVFDIEPIDIEPASNLHNCGNSQYCVGLAKLGDKVGILLNLHNLTGDDVFSNSIDLSAAIA
jgi:chemotaxis signal transduction protein